MIEVTNRVSCVCASLDIFIVLYFSVEDASIQRWEQNKRWEVSSEIWRILCSVVYILSETEQCQSRSWGQAEQAVLRQLSPAAPPATGAEQEGRGECYDWGEIITETVMNIPGRISSRIVSGLKPLSTFLTCFLIAGLWGLICSDCPLSLC